MKINLFSKKNITSLIFVVFSTFLWGQGSETITNAITGSPTSSYIASRTWTGDNSQTWTATDSRSDQTITGQAILIRNGQIDFGLTAAQKSAGIGDITFKAKAPFGSPDVGTIQILVDGVNKGGITTNGSSTSSVVTYTITGINITSFSTLSLKQTTSGSRIVIDDISWTAYSVPISPILAISGTPTNHGSVCPNTSATPVTYTITNTGTAASGINVTSNDSQFVVSGLSSTTIAGSGGTATFNVTFTPTSAGAKSATITATSTTSGSNSPTYALTGTGAASTAPTVTSAAAGSITATTATLNGNVTGLGTCSTVAIEKGFVYSITSVNAAPQVSGTGVTKTAVTPFSGTGAYTLGLTGLTSSTQYSFNSYVFDGTTYYYGTTRTFTTSCGTPTPAGTITATKNCGNTDLVYNFQAGEPASGVTYYWQTISNGTSTTTPATPSVADPTKSNPYNVTSAATYYLRGYNGTCWGTQLSSGAITIDAMPTITSQPTDQTVQAGNPATFSVSISGTNTRQWQVSTDGGFTWTNVGTGGSSYITAATTLSDEGKKYRVVVTNGACQVISNVATLYVYNVKPNNGLNLVSCIANNQIKLNWTAATGTPTPTGYIVFVLPGTTVPSESALTAGNASSITANSNYTLANTYGTTGSLGKAVFKGNATTATITGLTNTSQYTFKVVAYNGETQTGWASGITGTTANSWIQTYTIDVPEVTSLAASVDVNSSNITWTKPTNPSCYEYLVVANQGAVSFTPSGDGSSYTANSTYAGANQVVYKGTGNSVVVSGLTESVQYCYKVFVRDTNTNDWSDGTSVCQTTALVYCSSSGYSSSEGITAVEFNTINNTSTSTPAYSDYTSVSTNVLVGNSYDLSVKVNTNGNYTDYVTVWIDWNRNGSFNDSGESYSLGTATNVNNVYTDLSPLNITVPSSAKSGNTRMRVSSKEGGVSTSCEDFSLTSYGEVEDYTINISNPAAAEINVKGNNISIASGSTDVSSLNNTLFASTSIGSSTAAKTFVIENIGLASLNLSGTPIIQLEGDNPSSFTVTQQPSSSTINGVASNVVSTGTFSIQFNPQSAEVLSAIVKIINNDSDEGTYTFKIQGTGICNTPPIVSVYPTSGPANTIVTLSSASDLTGAVVKFNGNVLTPISSSSSQIMVQIPVNSFDGDIILKLANGCIYTQAFDVIDKNIVSCQSATATTTPTDLFMSEVTDSNDKSLTYIEIYNGTGSTKNLSNYRLEFYSNGSATNNGGSLNLNNYNLPNGGIYVIAVGSTDCSVNVTTNQTSGIGGINFTTNGNDHIKLFNGTTEIDQLGTYQNATWFNTAFPTYGVKGADFRRKSNASALPKVPFTVSDWTVSDYVDAGGCAANDYSDVGIFTLPVPTPPSISVQPNYIPDCHAINLNVTGVEGYVGGNPLAYQWYYLAPNTTSWVALSDGGVYSGSSTSVLNISSASGLNNYQYYVQVRENSATCYVASNAVQIKDVETKWNGTAWTNGTPTTTSKVVIEGNYDTSVNGNIDACSITLNSGQLNIKQNNYVRVQNEVINNTTYDKFLVESDGNLIQVNDGAATSGSIKVERNLNLSSGRNEYNYISSPLANFNLKNVYPGVTPTSTYPKVLYYNEGNDFFFNSTGAYIAGRGLALKEPLAADASSPVALTFTGVPYNSPIGFLNYTLAYSNSTHGYNLVGNPYPSNIDLNKLFTASSNIQSTFRFWDNTANNLYVQYGSTYAGFAYAIYNALTGTNGTGLPAPGSGSVAPGGTSDNGPMAAGTKVPNKIVKVGQGFMARATGSGAKIVFKNSERDFDNTGAQFFHKNSSKLNGVDDSYRLYFTTPNNLVVPIAVVYFDAGNYAFDLDDSGLDANPTDSFFSYADSQKVLINGRGTFVDTDRLNLGSSYNAAGTYNISLSNQEGVFANGQDIYLVDKVAKTVTNLQEGSYTFSSSTSGLETGRFEIVYVPQSTLGFGNNEKEGLLVYRQGDSFIVKSDKNISSIELLDVSGRLISILKPNKDEAIVDANKLLDGMYLLKIENNGKTTVRKIRK